MTSGVTVPAADLAIEVAGPGRSFGTTVELDGVDLALECGGVSACWARMVRAGRRRGTGYLPTQEL